MRDATPPVGNRMAYDPVTNSWELEPEDRELFWLPERRIVLCDGLDQSPTGARRLRIGEAGATTPTVHTC